MQFCKVCENKLYSFENDNKLYLKCKNCGFQEEQKNMVVHSKVYKESSDANQHITNKFLIYDVTLPRTNKKKCPNSLCISNKNKNKQEAVFFPNTKTMELIYICTNCNTEWKYT